MVSANTLCNGSAAEISIGQTRDNNKVNIGQSGADQNSDGEAKVDEISINHQAIESAANGDADTSIGKVSVVSWV